MNQGLTKQFGGLTAVSRFDASVEKGSVVGPIGPNGAGKSTLFNLITGVFLVEQKVRLALGGSRCSLYPRGRGGRHPNCEVARDCKKRVFGEVMKSI